MKRMEKPRASLCFSPSLQHSTDALTWLVTAITNRSDLAYTITAVLAPAGKMEPLQAIADAFECLGPMLLLKPTRAENTQ